MATFTNQATLSYNRGTVNSNIITGEIVEVLTATKTAVTNTYSTPDKITYVVSLINSGTTPLTNLTFTDNLGNYQVGQTTVYPLTYVDGSARYYTNGTLAVTPAVTAGPPLTITGVSVPAGGNATLIYETTTNGFTPRDVDSSVINTATISGDGLATPVTATETVTPAQAPDLTITKSVSPAVVSANGQLTYTFVIENFGNTAAVPADNISITDTFNPVLSGVTAAYNGTTLATPAAYTYNETTGLFTTVPGQITVPGATFATDPVTGAVTVTPGTATITVTGTI